MIMHAITKKAVLTADQVEKVFQVMELEDEVYYRHKRARSSSNYLFGLTCHGHPNPESDYDDWDCFQWLTAGGNILRIYKNGVIEVKGRRHGIPWEYLGGILDPRKIPIQDWDFVESQTSTRHPAFSGSGEDLVCNIIF